MKMKTMKKMTNMKMKNDSSAIRKKKLYFNKRNFVMKSKFVEIAKEVKRSNSW